MCVCVSPLSGPPEISASLGTCELEIHISVTGQERGRVVESWGMKWYPQPSLGAAGTTREQLPPKSTLGLSGPWDSPTTHRKQALYNLWRRMGERKGGTSQCPRAGIQLEGRDWSGGPMLPPLSHCCPCHLLCSPHSSFLRSYLIIQKKLGNLLLGREQQAAPTRIAKMSAQVALKLPSHTPPPAASTVLGAALTRWTFSLLTRSGSGVASLLFLSRITGVPKTFRCRKKRGLLASA